MEQSLVKHLEAGSKNEQPDMTIDPLQSENASIL